MQNPSNIRELLDQERYAEALRACETEIQRRGSGAETALLTARALVGLARLQEAETWVQRARVDLPDETRALRLLARIYRRRGWRVRAQAIERRLAVQPRPPASDEVPTVRAMPAAGVAVSRGDLPATLDATLDPSVEPSPPPPTQRLSANGPPPAPRAEAPLRREAAAPDPRPDPLGLLTAEEAEALRVDVGGGPSASGSRDPSPPRPTVAPPSREVTPPPAKRAAPPRPAAAPPAQPPPPERPRRPRERRRPVAEPTAEPEDDPAPERAPPPSTAPDEPSRRATPAGRETAAPSHVAPRPSRGLATPGVDAYVRQRRRSKLLLTLGLILVLAGAAAGVVLIREWRGQRVRLAYAEAEDLIDDADYEGLRQARALIDQALDTTTNPDPGICALGVQVELTLWLYYTGDRAYLNQAKRLLDDAELRGSGTPDTRMARGLWEGYLGDPSVALDIADSLEQAPGVRPDRPYLLRGISAAGGGDHALAARHLEKAASLRPTGLNHLAFAREVERMGARTDAIDGLEAVLEGVPGHMAATVDLSLLRAGEVTGPDYLSRVEATLETHNGKVPPRVMSRVFAAKAIGHFAQGDATKSARWSERALEEDRDNPELLRAFAHELRVRGDLAEARAQLARVETQQPFSGDALGELALIAYLQDRPDLVESRLDDFPEGARDGAAYRLAASVVQLQRGDASVAVDALSGLPQDLWAGEARLLLGDAQLASGHYGAARESFSLARREIERQRGSGDPRLWVAKLSRDLADARAQKRLRRDGIPEALAAHGEVPIVLYTAARLAEARGEQARAADLYQQAFLRGQDFALALVGFVRVSGGPESSEPLVGAAVREYFRISPEGPSAALLVETAG